MQNDVIIVSKQTFIFAEIKVHLRDSTKKQSCELNKSKFIPEKCP